MISTLIEKGLTMVQMRKYQMIVEVEAVKITKKNCKELDILYGFDFDVGLIEENIGCWILNQPTGLDIAPADLKLKVLKC